MKSFLTFITEEIKPLQDKLDSLGIDHVISHNKGTTIIYKMIVKKENRNKGLGSKVMKTITNYADAHNHRVALTPLSNFGGSKSRLITFYKRHDFIENKGKNKDFSIRETMYREPKH